MFNQGIFNQMPFNRTITVGIYGNFEIDHTEEFALIGNVVVVPNFEIDHNLEMFYDALRDGLGAFVLEHIGEAELKGTRDRTVRFDLHGKLEMLFSATRNHVEKLTFTGEFAPGDVIKIDSKLLTFTKNHQNALENMEGDFLNINQGQNLVTYTDTQTNRTVRMRITHRDKYV